MKNLKLLLIGVIGIAVLLVIVQNTAPFQGHFLWFTAEVPAVLLLLITALGGFILGLLVPLFMKKKEKSYRIIPR